MAKKGASLERDKVREWMKEVNWRARKAHDLLTCSLRIMPSAIVEEDLIGFLRALSRFIDAMEYVELIIDYTDIIRFKLEEAGKEGGE